MIWWHLWLMVVTAPQFHSSLLITVDREHTLSSFSIKNTTEEGKKIAHLFTSHIWCLLFHVRNHYMHASAQEWQTPPLPMQTTIKRGTTMSAINSIKNWVWYNENLRDYTFNSYFAHMLSILKVTHSATFTSWIKLVWMKVQGDLTGNLRVRF